jgi:hypothetical protein
MGSEGAEIKQNIQLRQRILISNHLEFATEDVCYTCWIPTEAI